MDIEARTEVSLAPATPQPYVPPLPPPSQLEQEQAQVPPPPAETPDTAAVAGITQEGVDTTSSAVVATTITATDKAAPPPQESSSAAPASATPADDSRTDGGGGGGGGGGEDSKDGGESREGGGKEGSSRPKRPREKDLPVGLPKSMVRRIMKLGEDTRNVSNEALVVVVKASELFLEKFAARAFGHAEKLGRRTIKYQDVSDVRVNDANLLFLEAVVPP